MATPIYTISPALRCLRNPARRGLIPLSSTHSFKTSTQRKNDTLEATPTSSSPTPPPNLDPNTVSTRLEELQLLQTGIHPIGSRRRRASILSSDNVPFEQMPYQCFQEARAVLAEDRSRKLLEIAEMRKRIAFWQNVPASDLGGEYAKKGKLVRMQKHLANLKILADVNDPVIKKRFEDGMGDMNRPIYRYLADRKWREYKRKIIMQRISQMHIVPDMLPHLDPTAEVSLGFGRRNVQPGEFVDSRVSVIPARLNVRVFDKGERLVSIAVVDPDVPDEERDSFGSRCHFLAVNVPLSPTATSIPLSKLKKEEHIVHPWLPPYAQKGAPYHRLAVFVLQQDDVGRGASLDIKALRDNARNKRDGFQIRRFVDKKPLRPIGMHLFRSKWDEGTDGVVTKAGIEGMAIEFKRKKPEKLPYKKKDGARYR
ncbi:MAG: hypothetical protein ALECFALPRED_007491 [Alectoria fallacina]|uniref:Large ribosomal subunit protein mL38 n=1 Tax=Alectoria fallacina TaxID=1903189 RepID=A0A8H3G8E5_9LECA|nr:MAG: hypothetical protein ALECFALPRED_007491 [Alectoria fallacina]